MGTVNLSLPSDGETIDSSDYNTPITTFVNEFNGEIDNANIASDAAIAGSKLANASVTPSQWTNPYCFRAYPSSGTSIADASDTKVLFQTEDYDYNSNFATSTYTAPVTGVYHFGGRVEFATAIVSGVTTSLSLYVNAAVASKGERNNAYSTTGVCTLSTDVPVTAGQTVELYCYQDSDGAEATTATSTSTFFYGHLVHAV